MKLAIFLVLAIASAVYAGPGAEIPILKYDNEGVNADGSYKWSYETGNGISAQEQGTPSVQGPEGPAIGAQGSYQYTSPEGIPISIVYVADDNGFQPQGDSIPVPPPIPPAILRALEWNAAHPEEEQPSQQQFAASNPQPAYKPFNQKVAAFKTKKF